MFRILALLMIVVPVMELWVLITVGKWIGAWYTIGLVILTGVIGAWLAKREGLHTLQLIRLQLSQGQMPGSALIDGACILVGGAALLTPGFITDAVGFLLLVPYTRNIFKAWLRRLFERWIKNGKFIIIRR
ncbi:FxsA cytoplasmic membrane protein [Caldalkalibacillus thermarum TA2.A1]|uniref:FxsA cytoplasmic membrane protein n=1 Tax=Caldalkalibacillus thermarum (strain TA2.A1) TaxID=986075 RepID=F5L942_CALTT|nr:FxsA family protein [Caldalkalibacillus thermarum]EGL82116.1 FxsA cytoplasmic membrane protein [Caldalkalibacillus thermarum TA2.A1]QZT34944.1 membrane protein FxsA [Caldalkalibacillus thermarum TA2.A1]